MAWCCRVFFLAWIQVSCFWSQFQLPIYFWNEKFGGNPFQPWDREQVSVLPALLLAGGWLQFWGEKGQLQIAHTCPTCKHGHESFNILGPT